MVSVVEKMDLTCFIKTSPSSDIGLRIRAVRKERKLTRVQLARKFKECGLPINCMMLVNYETGRTEPPASLLTLIAYSLGVEITDLLPPLIQCQAGNAKSHHRPTINHQPQSGRA